ncbi:MAG: hypothetical protein FWB90_10255 [Fibromonadales bacterium]|nr:hypothetical protein [Fibromonadales bacterium]
MIDCNIVEGALKELAQNPAVSWRVIGKDFEMAENGIRNENLKIIASIVADENVPRTEIHEIIADILKKVSGVVLQSNMLPCEPVNWIDKTKEESYSEDLIAAQVEFSAVAPLSIISVTEDSEVANESIRENIRLAFKGLFCENFNWHYIPTASDWQYENDIEFKCYWKEESEATDESIHSYLRREDILIVEVCLPELKKNWQGDTSTILENFNYDNMNQAILAARLPDWASGRLGFLRIGNAAITAGFNGVSLVRVEVSTQYMIGGKP